MFNIFQLFTRSLDGILGNFTKLNKELEKFTEKAEKKIGTLNAKADVAKTRAEAIGTEVDKAKQVAENIRNLLGAN